MGSNMQRQAVPLVKAEAPLVGTGMEALWRGIPVLRSPRARRCGRSGRRHAYRYPGDGKKLDPGQAGRRHLQSVEIPALQPEHLHQPAAAGEVVGDG